MFILICILVSGILGGILLRKHPLKYIGKLLNYSIYALLFLIGLGIGANKEILYNLSSLGLDALCISVAATLGSVIMAWIVWKLFFKKDYER